MRKLLLCLSLLLPAFSLFAQSERVDFDLDDDGLIEINDLFDLDEIRNHLDGSALYGLNTGCPELGCNGFELSQNLDFDSDGNGQVNAMDVLGAHFTPISTFTSIFEGNGYVIYNLSVNTSNSVNGLFGRTDGASIQNLG